MGPYLPSRWLITSADQANDPSIFPFIAGQGFLQLKTPVWSTKIDMSVSGIERRRALWSYPIWKFKLSYEFMRDAPALLELQSLVTFFNQHSGAYQEWFYFDRYDNTVTNQQIGTGDGVTTTFQLTRTSTVGGITFTEPVRGVSGTPVVTVGGVATSAYTVGTLGAITFTTSPAAAAVVAWSGNFFFLCRFGKDELDISQMMQGFFVGNSIEFMTVKN
jgi:uncharacterized protein (TIGR02217 family)